MKAFDPNYKLLDEMYQASIIIRLKIFTNK